MTNPHLSFHCDKDMPMTSCSTNLDHQLRLHLQGAPRRRFLTICPSLIVRCARLDLRSGAGVPLPSILLGIDANDTEGLLKQLATLLPLKEHELILVYVHNTGARGEMALLRGRLPGRLLPEVSPTLQVLNSTFPAGEDLVFERP
jgi:hypothetical protein